MQMRDFIRDNEEKIYQEIKEIKKTEEYKEAERLRVACFEYHEDSYARD